MKNTLNKNLPTYEGSLNEASNKDYLDFLKNNFTKEKYSYTPLRDFHVAKTKATFSPKTAMTWKANEPMISTYRAFELADILMSEFPELDEDKAFKIIKKWKGY